MWLLVLSQSGISWENVSIWLSNLFPNGKIRLRNLFSLTSNQFPFHEGASIILSFDKGESFCNEVNLTSKIWKDCIINLVWTISSDFSKWNLSELLQKRRRKCLNTQIISFQVFKHAKRLGYGEHDVSAVYIRARFWKDETFQKLWSNELTLDPKLKTLNIHSNLDSDINLI